MPNFEPMKAYTLRQIDELISSYGLRAPFLDAGCGRGDVARHLADRHSWHGVAADGSPSAAVAARRTLEGTGVAVISAPIAELEGEYRTVVLSTVIEHIADDHEAIRQLRARLPERPGEGHLLISMPTNPSKEWRWDDDFYGHYRRYTRDDVEKLLDTNGFRLLELWDYTYPVFWAMRRVAYRVLPAKPPPADVPEAASAESSLTNAWESKSSTVVSRVPVWGMVERWQRRHRAGERGFEAMALAVTA